MTSLHLLIYRLFCWLESVLSVAWGGERRRQCMAFEEPLRSGLARLAEGGARRSLVVFAPTVGEFNSVKPVIALYRAQWPDDRLVLLTAYDQYLELYARTFPDAVVGLASFRSPWLMARFFDTTRPRLLIISEGPALHACFPQRLEVALPAACMARAIPVVVSNAVLFERAPQSRIDRLENALFSGLFTKAIQRWFPPFPEFREALLSHGLSAEKIQSLGELRFDSLHVAGMPKSAGLEALLGLYRTSPHPVLVAGSVNQATEQRIVVDAWRALRARYPQIRLVIAPRYVNNPEVMGGLRTMLVQAQVDFILRSDPASNQDLHDVLVIDTFGELGHFYSVATASYIGRDHGVLEPLAYGCPTIVGTGWRRNYSATPIYDYMVGRQGVICAANACELSAVVQRLIEEPAFLEQHRETTRRIVAQNAGAAQRIFAVLQSLLTEPTPLMSRREAVE